MTFESDKMLSFGNIKVAVRHPSLVSRLLAGGRIEAFRSTLSYLMTEFSQLDDIEVRTALNASNTQRRLMLSKPLSIFNGSITLTNPLMLYCLVRVYKPSVVIETGVWTGKTSWAILQALDDNNCGSLTSIDIGSHRCGTQNLPVKEVGDLVPRSLRSRWRLLVGDSRTFLPRVFTENKCDFFYHDSDHSYENMIWEFRFALGRLSPCGILASDDVSLNGAFQEATTELASPVVIGGRFGYGFKRGAEK